MNKSIKGGDEINQMMVNELNSAVKSIDDKTSAALRAARKRALVQQAPDKSLFSFSGAHGVTVFASVMVVAMIVTLVNKPALVTSEDISATGSSVAGNTEALESLPILISPDDLDFYQSVDFLFWMEKNTG